MLRLVSTAVVVVELGRQVALVAPRHLDTPHSWLLHLDA